VLVRMVTDSDNLDEDEVQELIRAGIPVLGDRAEGLDATTSSSSSTGARCGAAR